MCSDRGAIGLAIAMNDVSVIFITVSGRTSLILYFDWFPFLECYMFKHILNFSNSIRLFAQ